MNFTLEVRNISKRFPGVVALQDVSLQIAPGQVHALAGENGAGKSTLVKIIAGLLAPDEGTIRRRGVPVRFGNAHDALRNGVAMIHQELMPFPDMTVAENVCMGREPARFGWVDRRAMHHEASRLLGRLRLNIDPARPMRGLSVAEMQGVEIARALGYDAEVLIMDEPTAALPDREAEALLGVIGDLRREGKSVIYISHRMSEIFRISDSVTVLRDGCHMATLPTAETIEPALISMMVGREFASVFPDRPTAVGEPALQVSSLTRAGKFRNVSFEVRRGEIVGLAGLMGAGRSEVAEAIFGLAPADSGEIRVDGRPVRIAAPSDALDAGIALVTEDRKGSGIVPQMPVGQNITLASLKAFCQGPVVDRAREDRAADEQIRRFGVRTANRHQPIRELSGGNQQKALIARALLREPRVIILDEPTRGIDVGAKAEIYSLIASLARAGTAVLLISSEMTEVLALSTRVIVMRQGTVAAELEGGAATGEEVLRHAMAL